MNKTSDDKAPVAKSSLYSKKLQDLLNKLISEEMLANLAYRTAVMKCKLIDAVKLNKLFQTIADDELADHYKNLVTFAAMNDFTVPVQEKEYKKYASKECWKIYDNLKKEQDISYYIKEMVELEKDAIASYDAALKTDIPYELVALIQPILYDEIEHLDDLKTLSIAIDASADLSWIDSYNGEQPDFSYFWPYSYSYGACTIS